MVTERSSFLIVQLKSLANGEASGILPLKSKNTRVKARIEITMAPWNMWSMDQLNYLSNHEKNDDLIFFNFAKNSTYLCHLDKNIITL